MEMDTEMNETLVLDDKALPAEGATQAPSTIIEKVEQFVRRFVFFKDDSLYRLVALWIVATHLHSAFEYTGYLFAYSARPQSGKSRLLEVLDLLVLNSSGILISPTEAVLFHTASGGTQLLDEVDSWSERDTLRSVLNAGFRRGNTVPRMSKTETEGYDLKRFPVYGPRALAGIGQKILPETTRDRTFMLEMLPQKPEERREQFRVRQIQSTADALRGEIEEWAASHCRKIVTCYDKDGFPYLERFRDRTMDVAQPLAAILEVVYKGSSELERARIDFVKAIAITRKEEEHLAEDMRILGDLRKLAATETPLIGSASELATMDGLRDKTDEYQVSAVLRRYGFETKSIRKGGMPKHRYLLEAGKLDDLLGRFGGSPPTIPNPLQPTTQVTTG
jgi:hypothetical protein